MNIYFINICLDWIYNLYKDYIFGLKSILEKYQQINKIQVLYIPLQENSLDIFFKEYNIIKNKQNYKIILCGEISKVCSILKENIENDPNLYFLNIEQMSNPSYYKYFRELPNTLKIIDYSEENMPYFKDIYKNTFLLPPYFNSIQNQKTIDILSLKNNEYRESILTNLKFRKKYETFYFTNIYDETRDILYSKSKVYLNLHCSDNHKTMELIRMINLLSKNVIILTQNSIHKDLIFIKDSFIIFEKVEEIPILLEEILNNYNLYYNKIFSNKNIQKYNDYIHEKYNTFLQN